MRVCVLLALAAAFGPRRGPGHDPRKDLPGMKRDAFDDMMSGGPMPGAGPGKKAPVDLDPVCPEGDGRAPFATMVIVDRTIYVRPKEDGECMRLLEFGGANVSYLVDTARKECGRGWKEKLVEAMSVIFQRANLDWPMTAEESTKMPALVYDEVNQKNVSITATLSEANYETAKGCWKKGCGCKQTRHPIMTGLFYTCGALMLGGVLWDGGRLVKENSAEKKRKEEKRKRKEEKRRLKEEAKAAKGEGEPAESPDEAEEAKDTAPAENAPADTAETAEKE